MHQEQVKQVKQVDDMIATRDFREIKRVVVLVVISRVPD